MHIKELALLNYRNYEEAHICFSDGINILYGDNAQGKTNILEAIYLLGTTKSHRGSKDKEIIRFEQSDCHLRAQIKKMDMNRRIDMHLKKSNSKGIAIDMVPIRRSVELLGLMNLVFFSPEDLSIIKNGPSERRNFMDMELCQLNKLYVSNLNQYKKVLEQRNSLLKQIAYDRTSMDMLSVWNEQFVQYGSEIIRQRQKFIDLINEIIPAIHRNLTGGRETLTLIYDKNTEEDFLQELEEKIDMDLRYQSTQIGPHRDDIIFLVDDMDVRKFGSQGQQRTVALSLKLAEIELVKKTIHENPILLLDDVMSELDSKRRDALLDSIKGIQTIITCTGYDDFIKERLTIDKVYKIVSGTIQEELNG
ncbi:MAG: DNA replication/repair protein RecF [Wujia sp.]